MHESKRKGSLRFTKDYEAICKEWLGGLKPEKYKSLIISNQLGRHLAALKATCLDIPHIHRGEQSWRRV